MNLFEIKKNVVADLNEVGGKGFHLLRLIDLGLNVPTGFIISARSENLSPDEETLVLQAFHEFGFKSVAVRSSATVEDSKTDSFAGIFESFLNINEESLIDSINKCIEAIHSDRVQSYCEKRNINYSTLQLAVIVQEMVNADYSGVAFSKDPITGEDDIVVELVYGSGEKLVSGEVTPVSFIVSHGLEIKFTSSDDSFIDKELIKTIAKSVISIKKSYGLEVDIEFCIKERKIYILQVRPITV